MFPLNPERAVLLARAILLELGLEEVARSSDSESVYVRSPGSLVTLRISNHRRTSKRRQQYPDVVHSLIFREPKSERQVHAMTKRALDAYCRAKRSQAPPVDASGMA